MTSITLDVEEFVQMASYVFGSNWQSDLSEKFGIRLMSLVLILGDGSPVLAELSEPLCDLVEEKIARTDQRLAALRRRPTQGNRWPNRG